ncbi:MAG: biopolymer transporter ExbD [Planctomycetota bacterium]|nr:biopolymer transporter ExbD [Planctomycetota bacterium]
MQAPEETRTEVDMVPMIDIVTLLLMFLVIVGDMAATAGAIQMKLPRADQAMTDKTLKEKGFRLEGRLIVQMQSQGGVYRAVVNNKSYDLVKGGSNKGLLDYLCETVEYAVGKGNAKRSPDGAVDMPVKLRIPEDAPMRDVERVVMSLARAGLVNIHYTAEPFSVRSGG